MSKTENAQPLLNQADIDKLFETRIVPKLHGLEQERQTVLKEKNRRWRNGGIGAATIAAVVLILCQTNGLPIWIPILVAVGAGLIVWIWADLATSDYQDHLRKAFMDAICKALGGLYYAHLTFDDPREAMAEFELQPYRDVHLIPSYHSAKLEDLLMGRYRDCDFTLVEATLTTKSTNGRGGSSTVTVFDGMLFQLQVPQPIRGKVLIARDYGKWINKLRDWWRDGVRVDIPHPEFEKRFAVYASSEALGLQIVTPAFVENFLALRKVFGTDKIRAAFIGSQFYVAAQRKSDFLEGFSASTPAADLKPLFEQIAHEVQLVHRIIDQLHQG